MGNTVQFERQRKETTKEEIKALRVEVDKLINTDIVINKNLICSIYPEVNVKEHLIEAKMWLGKCLEDMGSELPKEYQDQAE